ncbi:hypothetical protein [Anaeromassilibacillus sp. SJQ-1]|uniref:hypothetical protein n=1 Tax=Anaeromassilibacillus sp. SJQ-1 TaxID=3375419 RepID=UPI0039897432
MEDCPGVVGIAGKLCTCDEQYNGILHSLLGRIVVAEDLDAATAVARRYRYRFRIVTLDGQVVNTGGSLTGGSLARNSGLLSRASDIERIRAQADQLREKAEEAAAALRSANEEASAAEAALAGARGELATAQEERIRIEAEHDRAKADRRNDCGRSCILSAGKSGCFRTSGGTARCAKTGRAKAGRNDDRDFRVTGKDERGQFQPQ